MSSPVEKKTSEIVEAGNVAEQRWIIRDKIEDLSRLFQSVIDRLDPDKRDGLPRLTGGTDKDGCPTDMTDHQLLYHATRMAEVLAKMNLQDFNLSEKRMIHEEHFAVWFRNHMEYLRKNWIQNDDDWTDFVKEHGQQVGMPVFGEIDRRRKR